MAEPAVTTWWQRFVDGWNAFWFQLEAPTNLAVCRIVFYGVWCVKAAFAENYLANFVGEPASFRFPMNVFRYVPVPSLAEAHVLHWILVGACALAALGLAFRFSAIVVFFAQFYIASESSSLTKIVHLGLPLIWISAFLMLSRAGDALSLDRLVRERWPAWRFAKAREATSSAYRWPVQMACVYVVVVFLFGALSKLKSAGLDWVIRQPREHAVGGPARPGLSPRHARTAARPARPEASARESSARVAARRRDPARDRIGGTALASQRANQDCVRRGILII